MILGLPDRETQRWFPTLPWLARLLHRPWLIVSGAIAGELAALGLFIGAPWGLVGLGAVAAGSWAGWVRRRRGEVSAWRVSEWGLQVVRYGRPNLLLPWSGIEALEETPEGWRLRAGKQAWLIPRGLAGGERLAALVREQLGGPEDVSEQVTASQIAHWLGIGPGETLATPPVRGRWAMLAAEAVCAIYWLVRAISPYPRHLNPYALVMALGFLACAAWFWARTRPLLVSAEGLELPGRRRMGWDAVLEVEEQGGQRWLRTAFGTGRLNSDEGARIGAAAALVVAARERGELLPRLAEVPDHAISRAESVDVSAARGISRAEGDDR